MANKRREPVGYKPFRTQPLLAEGLLGVARPGGEFYERVASGLFRLADEAGRTADRQAQSAGARAGQQAALAGRPQIDVGAAPGAAGGDHRQIAAEILRREESFRDTPYWDVNALRTGYGSDTVTLADGSVQKVTKDTRVSRADGERDLSRRLTSEFEPRASGQVGVDNWNRLPPAARGALLSVTYNYGSLPPPVVAAVKTGDAGQIADAVGKLRSNKARRGREAEIIRRGAGGGGGAPAPAASTGGGFRPGGRDTIYGRAFDEAGARTYVQMLDAEMRSTTAQLYEKHQDDPNALQAALGDLRGVLGRDHVFEEIQPDFEIGFDRLAEGYLSQARGNMQKKIEAADQAQFVERTTALQTDVARRIASFDPASDGAADAIASAQEAVDLHYDDAVDRGLLDPARAETAKAASRREAAIGFYSRQAEAMDAAGVSAMREEMRADFAAGTLEGLDGDGYAVMDSALDKLAKAKLAERDRIGRELAKAGDGLASRVAEGFGIDPAAWADFLLSAGQADNGEAIVKATERKLDMARIINGKPIAEARTAVRAMRQQLGDSPSDEDIAALTFAEAMLSKTENALSKDPIGLAEAMRVIEPQAAFTEADSLETLAGLVAQRIEAADQAAAHYGTAARILKPGEAKGMADMIRADPQRGAGFAGAIVAGAGGRARQLLAEFGNDAPMIAEAGAILAFGGSARAAEDVIGGYARPDGRALKGLKTAEARESLRSQIGGAMVYAGDDMARIERAAAAITRKRIADEGLDPASEEALSIHARAVHEAAGAVYDKGVQFGGFAEIDAPGLFAGSRRVLVSPEIRADRFDDILGSIRDEDLAALPVKPKAAVSWLPGGVGYKTGTARTLRQAVPIAVAGGYVFAVGDPAGDDPQLIEGDDGRAFVLDLMALKERLAPRVPGGFR